MSLESAIQHGIDALGLRLPAGAVPRLAAYIALLARWNRAYNLTAVREPAEMVGKHILDSLAILPWLQGPTVLDVGSGAGLPGIPLAIARPDLAFTLLDSSGKRTRFMEQAVTELGLVNVHVVWSRVEDYRPEAAFACVVSRAFASLADMLVLAGRLCAAGGCLLAMKGQRPEDELRTLPPGYRLLGVEPLAVPGLDAERCLVRLAPAGAAER
ncbi:MAG TPA: 16S rRNA (guanine(527)-N(7))-methyltransferase RsmG [Candidatus Competibacteraceae bacterium]|nr:16S rRNA (guanine(527)-N(7))-methyltransferase RsmG [Candidatus Competibacteraceae bacterium]